MISTIGPSSLASTTAGGTSAAGIEAQIARYQKELSDCVNCDSANTREGKEKIQTISDKISSAKARLEEITARKSSNQPTAPNTATSPDISADKDGPASRVKDNNDAAGLPNSNAGTRLDVFA